MEILDSKAWSQTISLGAVPVPSYAPRLPHKIASALNFKEPLQLASAKTSLPSLSSAANHDGGQASP